MKYTPFSLWWMFLCFIIANCPAFALSAPMMNATSHTQKVQPISGSYRVFLENTMSGQAPITKSWVGVSKLSLLSQCRSLAKYKKWFLVRCVWRDVLIYSSQKTDIPLPIILTGSSISNTGSTELGLYELYLNGKIILTTKELSKVQALANCETVIKANSLSETSCKWNGESMWEFIPTIEISVIKINPVTTSIKPYTYLLKNSDNEIGRFSLFPNTDKVKFTGISLLNLGSTSLETIVENNSWATIIDVSTQKVISTGSIIGNLITFSGMSDPLKKETLKTYILNLQVGTLENNQSTSTLQFQINPIDLTLQIGTGTINPIGTTFQTPPYSVGILPPTLTIVNTNESTFKFHIVNPDTNGEITLSGISMDVKLNLPSGKVYTAIACFRDIGNQEPCGMYTIPVNYPFSSIFLPTTGLSTNTTLEKKNGFTDFEMNFISQNIFPTKWTLEVIVRSITYVYNGKTFTQNYYGSTWFSAKYTK